APALLGALKRRGFLAVELSLAEEKVLLEALGLFSKRRSFRYPPVPTNAGDLEEKPEPMPGAFARCFDLLYGVACSAALLMRGRRVRPESLAPCKGGMPFAGPG
ncbi:unnamed protein product, partial [Effrenium voratum]